MQTTTQRVLALGGPPWSSLERHQESPYLPRVLLAALCCALLSSTLISVLFRNEHSTVAPVIVNSNGGVIVTFDEYILPPADGGIVEGWTQPLVRPKTIIPLPVPDAELMHEEEEFESLRGAAAARVGNGDNDGLTSPGPGSEGWTPSRPEPPAIFLFVEVPPELVSLVAPAYPELAREAGVEGTVLVEVLVSELGQVLEATVKQGLPLLDEAALAAASSALFRPAQQSGRPVRTRVVIPIEFSLRH